MGSFVGASIGTALLIFLLFLALALGLSALLRPFYIWLLGTKDLLDELRANRAELRRLSDAVLQQGATLGSPPATATPPAKTRAVVCPHCGAENRSVSNYCWECGRPLQTEA